MAKLKEATVGVRRCAECSLLHIFFEDHDHQVIVEGKFADREEVKRFIARLQMYVDGKDLS
jgi:molybdate-binding protein